MRTILSSFIVPKEKRASKMGKEGRFVDSCTIQKDRKVEMGKSSLVGMGEKAHFLVILSGSFPLKKWFLLVFV